MQCVDTFIPTCTQGPHPKPGDSTVSLEPPWDNLQDLIPMFPLGTHSVQLQFYHQNVAALFKVYVQGIISFMIYPLNQHI